MSVKTILVGLACFASLLQVQAANKTQASAEQEILATPPQGKLNYKLDDWRNYFGSWCGGASDSLRFARNMGMRHILYQRGMERCKDAKGMNFYYADPEYLTYKRNIDFAKKYSEKDIKKWREFCAMKDASLPFPHCMATGWFFHSDRSKINGTELGKNVCSLIPNLQKQKVIDEMVKLIMARVRTIQYANPDFRFAGFVWDVPQLEGDFWGRDKNTKRLKQVGMSHWRGVDSVSVPEGVKLDYPTYCEGRVAYYRHLRKAANELNPKTKFIMDPAIIYGHYVKDFVRLGVKPNDPALADMVQLEFGSDEYLKDKEAWASGYLKAENMANAVDYYCYSFEKEIIAVASIASVGGWSAWFGNPCPGAETIRDVPARMKLSRAIATWENLNNTPIAQRQWNKEKLLYNSPTAHMSKDLLWATHPETKKIFFCYLNKDAVIKIPEGMVVDKIYPLTSLFGEYTKREVKRNFKIYKGNMTIREHSQYLVGEAFSMSLKPKPVKEKK